MDQRFLKMLADICNDNGEISVGLGATSDPRVAEEFRIPVPANIGAYVGFAGRLKVAFWAFAVAQGRQDWDDDVKKLHGVMWFVAYMMGWVRVRGALPAIVPQTHQELLALDWDAEVRVSTHDATDPSAAVAVPPGWVEAKIDVGRVTSLIVAAKMTWFSTKHHLGATMATASGQRRRQGFTEKFVNSESWGIGGWTLGTNESTAKIHSLVHPSSTIGVLRSVCIAGRDSQVSDLVNTWDVIREGAQFQADAQALTLNLGGDVKLRIDSLGAGCRKLADIIVGLKALLHTPIAAFMPHRDAIIPLAAQYNEIINHRFQWGENSQYLSGTHRPVPEDALTRIMAPVKTFIQGRGTGGSLCRAAVYTRPVNEDEGFDPTWQSVCATYGRQSVKGSAVSSDQIVAAMKGFGGLAGAAPSNDFITAVESLGISVPREAWERAVEAADAVDSDEDGSESGETRAKK